VLGRCVGDEVFWLGNDGNGEGIEMDEGVGDWHRGHSSSGSGLVPPGFV
jgi:hypothetical protein